MGKLHIFLLMVFCTISLWGCYQEIDPLSVLSNADKAKVYWIGNNGKQVDTLLMGTDTINVAKDFTVLFTGVKINTSKNYPTPLNGQVEFYKEDSLLFVAGFSNSTNGFVQYGKSSKLSITDSARQYLAEFKAPNRAKFEWLNGTWMVRDENDRPIFEEWDTHVDSAFAIGSSYSIYGGDTSVIERFSIIKDGAIVKYKAVIKGKEYKRPMFFEWTPSQNDSEISFVNPWQDFPRTITYKKISNDTLAAIVKGRDVQLEMKMLRIKQDGKQ